MSPTDRMTSSALTALSPLDGRYGPTLAALRPLLSEFGLIHHRLMIEIRWLQALSAAPDIPEVPAFSSAANDFLEQLLQDFSLDNAQRVKDIETTINHDVKAV
ncbi:MAG: hypothetical protein QGG10_04185, partial [Arenicellales bacterium]|nr:hypothetical protein [Arenicellales bacterium]